MPIHFSCSCGKAFRASERAAGKRVKCPLCGSVMVVPQPKTEDDLAGKDSLDDRSSGPAHDADRETSSSSSAKKRPPTPSVPAGDPARSKHDRRVVEDRAKQQATPWYARLPSKTGTTNLLEYA